jgi:hypothetical protein
VEELKTFPEYAITLFEGLLMLRELKIENRHVPNTVPKDLNPEEGVSGFATKRTCS